LMLSGPGPRLHRDRCPVPGVGGVCGVVLEGGTLTSSAGSLGGLLVLRLFGGVWIGVGGVGFGS